MYLSQIYIKICKRNYFY